MLFDVIVLCEIVAVFVCHLCMTVFILINQHFKWQIKSDAWVFLHQHRAHFRLAKYNGYGWSKCHVDAFGIGCVVDFCKDFDAFAFEYFLQIVCSRIDIAFTLFDDYAGLQA